MSENSFKHSDAPRSKKTVYYVLIALAGAALIAALIWGGIKLLGGRNNNFDEYKNSTPTSSTESTDSSALPENPINFAEIQQKNPDVCAWIQIPGIEVIDYPIMQSSVEANDNFYLYHDINGSSKRAGSIYIQKLNHKDFADPNTLIYGHNMLNGTMFGQLKKFRNKTFFDEHRTIFVYTPDEILEYEIISAFVYDDRHIMNSFNFSVENECQEFFDECVNPTSFTKQVLDGATLTTDDKIITLSTCTSNDSERYLVVGKLIETTKTAK